VRNSKNGLHSTTRAKAPTSESSMIACNPAMNSLSQNGYGYIYIYKGIYVYNIQKKICIYYRRRIYIYVYKSVIRQSHQRNPNINQEIPE
jgi:hypothetical protein